MPHRFVDDAEALTTHTVVTAPLFGNHRRVTMTAVGIGVVILGLGIWQLTHNVTQPFRPSPEALEVDFSYLDAEQNAVERSKQIDTDGDGLSDYDEQQLYQTSIYLTDTDSDGVSDRDEVIKGKDPRCPEGQTCENFDYYGPSPTTVGGANALTWLQANDTTAQAASAVGPEAFQQMLLSGQIGTAELRQLLIENGLPAADVNALTDEEVLAIVYQALEEEATSQPPATETGEGAIAEPTPGAALTAEQRAAFEQQIALMSGTEIRQTLIDSGIDPKLLEGQDDESLRQFLLQSLTLGN